jgi:hypothetical protein
MADGKHHRGLNRGSQYHSGLGDFEYRAGSARDEFVQEIWARLVEDIETTNDSQGLPVIEWETLCVDALLLLVLDSFWS